MKRLILAATILAAGCGETDECKGLESLLALHEEALNTAKGQAEAHDTLVPKAAAAEKSANAVLAELGFDLDEEKLADALAARVEAVGGASMSRKTAQEATNDKAESRTYWEVALKARTAKEAMEKIWKIAATPPLFELRKIAAPNKGTLWLLSLYRATVDRIPIRPNAVPLPFPPDPKLIESQFGFCGAGDARKKIAAIRAEMKTVQAKAEGTTILLPTMSSWMGIERRARRKLELENEVRRVAGTMFEQAIVHRIDLKGIGYESPTIILDAAGSPKKRAKLESALAGKVDGVKTMEAPKGTFRLSATNSKVRASAHGPGGAERH